VSRLEAGISGYKTFCVDHQYGTGLQIYSAGSGRWAPTPPPPLQTVHMVPSKLWYVGSVENHLELDVYNFFCFLFISIYSKKFKKLSEHTGQYVNISVVDPYGILVRVRICTTDLRIRILLLSSVSLHANKKISFFLTYFCLLHFEATFTTVFKEKKPQNSTYKTVEIKGFLTFFA
jgi:hypothetical protein